MPVRGSTLNTECSTTPRFPPSLRRSRRTAAQGKVKSSPAGDGWSGQRRRARETPARRGPGSGSRSAEAPLLHPAVPAGGRDALAQSPAGPGAPGRSAEPRGTPGERRENSSHLTAAEELREGSCSCLGFPNCKQPATETTLLAERSCTHRDPEVGERGGRTAFLGTRSAPWPRLLPIGPPSAYRGRGKGRAVGPGFSRRPAVSVVTAGREPVRRRRGLPRACCAPGNGVFWKPLYRPGC